MVSRQALMIWNLWNRSPSEKRAHYWTFTQEEMVYESSPAKAPPLSGRRMMPPTPMQSSHSSYEERQWQIEVEDQIRNARDKVVNAKTKQYLDESDSVKAEVEELESLLGPEDSEVDFGPILEEARNKQGRAIFETFSFEGPSDFLVVSRVRWDEQRRKR